MRVHVAITYLIDITDKKVHAVKFYRRFTNVGLKEAKVYVESHSESRPTMSHIMTDSEFAEFMISYVNAGSQWMRDTAKIVHIERST